VVFNKQYVAVPDKGYVYNLNGRPIDITNQYKYLGLVTAAARDMSVPMMAGVVTRGNASVAALSSRYGQLGITSNFVLKRNLFDAIVTPNLTFGCEVWGPWYLHNVSKGGPDELRKVVFDRPIEKVRLNFYRRLLHLKKATSSWCLYRELGEYPLMLFIARQCVRFYRKILLDFPKGTWARVAMVDAWRMYVLHEGTSGTWFDMLIPFFETVGVGHSSVTDHPEHPVWLYDEREVEDRILEFCHQVFLRESPSTKQLWYHSRFAHPIPPSGHWPQAAYLNLPVDASKLALLARLRLRNHYLKIETSTWGSRRRGREAGSDPEVVDNACTVCGDHLVEDEDHYFFRCSRFMATRVSFPTVFQNEHITSLLELFLYDRSRPDWAAVLRDAIRFLTIVGCIFSHAQ
jgi:hypothetical protein